MSFNRRNFLKTLGTAGLTFTLGKSFGASTKKKDHDEFYGILYDSTRCIGCQSCEFACAEKYGLPDPTGGPDPSIVRQTSAKARIVVNAFNTSKGVQFMRKACNHCNRPACASSCLVKAMYKTDIGPVIWRENKCIGCRMCMMACPFDIPKYEYNSPDPIVQKCIMCYELVKKGELPACVKACPVQAIVFGKRKDLLDIAKARIYKEPKKYNHHIYGENEVGGTGVMYLAAVPFEELGCRMDLGTTAYPEYNKTFLYSVPVVLTLGPVFLLGLNNALVERKNRIAKENMN